MKYSVRNFLLLKAIVASAALHIALFSSLAQLGDYSFFFPSSSHEFSAELVEIKGAPSKQLARAPKTSIKSLLKNEQSAPAELSGHTPAPSPEVVSTVDEDLPESVPVQSEPVVAHAPSEPAPVPEPESNPENVAQLPQEREIVPQFVSIPRIDDPPPPLPEKKNDIAQLIKLSKERLSYNIYWSGIYVGRAVLEAVEADGKVKITSQVHSAAFISAFYKVEDFAESVVVNGLPAHFKIKQREGKYRSNKETRFDTENNKITFFNYLKGTKDEHTPKETMPWDVISGFYFLRTQPLEIGKPVFIHLFDSNKLFKAEVAIVRKEKVSLLDKGEVEAIVVRPQLQTEGLFKSKGDIFVWLTDDESRIPVRVETKVPIGTVTAELSILERESK